MPGGGAGATRLRRRAVAFAAVARAQPASGP